VIDPVKRAAAVLLRNLLIVHTPPLQDLSDWLEVKSRIDDWAPDIEVKVVNNRTPDADVSGWQVSRPSLVFSPHRLIEYCPTGGTVYAGARLSKLEQIERLAGHAFLVPPTLKLTRDLRFEEPGWGRFVVVKPQYGASGEGVQLLKKQDVAGRYAALTMDARRDMIVQPYVEHSEDGYPTGYRVLTLFGHALYAIRSRWAAPRDELEDIASSPDGIIASNSGQFGRLRQISNDPEIVALGESVHVAFPECPVLGVDIVREVGSGKLYIMEVNPLGPWHLSSNLAKTGISAEHRRERYAQFGALDRIARLLIEKTRAEAT
jgi:hypothetical protein